MNPLHEKILQQCRDEVSKTPKENRWGTVGDMLSDEQEAALRAMERLGEFLRWASRHKWRNEDPFMDGGYWYKNSGVYRGNRLTDEELYQEFEKQRG